MIAIYNIIESLKLMLETEQKETSDKGSTKSNSQVRISVFGVVRRMREQRYCMVQTISQYEFIYEYLLDYLSERGLIKLKFPRDAFGVQESDGDDDAEQDEEVKLEHPVATASASKMQPNMALQGTSRKLELKKFSLPQLEDNSSQEDLQLPAKDQV